MLTVRLRVLGRGAQGAPFKEDGRTITLNRHGARIRTRGALQVGQKVHIINQAGHSEADFRVVGPLSPVLENEGEWGVECLQTDRNIWGIQFPLLPNGESAYAKGLLECRRCHCTAFLPLSAVEYEVLESAGILSRACEKCGSSTSPWGFAEKHLQLNGSVEEDRLFREAQALVQGTCGSKDDRKHRRVAIQLPLLIRDFYGQFEISRTENVSKSGFCFLSEKTYYLGQGISAACPYNPESENIEVPARFVRAQQLRGTQRNIYGVRYEPQGPENGPRET
jgi:PilZ domain-containing protein